MAKIEWRGLRAYVLATASEARRDWPFYAIIISYALVVLAATLIHGVEEIFLPFLYIKKWLRPVFLVIAIFLTGAAFASLRSEAPLKEFSARIYRVLPPARAASVLLFLGLAVFHGVFTSLKNLSNLMFEFSLDPKLAYIDAIIHFGDPWKLLPLWEPFTRFLQILYSFAWTLTLAGMSFYVTLFVLEKTRNQYIWTFLICWIVLGNVIAIETMSAGPAYYEQVVGSNRFEPLMNYLSFSGHSAFSSLIVQVQLWRSYESGTVDIGSGISAFPSLHLAMGTLWTLVAYQVNKWFGRFMVLFTVLILIGSVHLGWHYAIDGYVAILATVACWKIVGFSQRPVSLSQQTMPAFDDAVAVRSVREPS